MSNSYGFRTLEAFAMASALASAFDNRSYGYNPRPPKGKNYKANSKKKRARKRTQKAKRNNRG